MHGASSSSDVVSALVLFVPSTGCYNYFTLPSLFTVSGFSWSAHRVHRMLMIASTGALSLAPLLAASLPCVPTFSREIYYNR